MKQRNKFNYLKCLLFTTSSLACFSGDVYALNGVSQGVNSFLGNDDWGLGRELQNGDNVQVGQDNTTLRYDLPLQGGKIIQEIRLNNLNLQGNTTTIILQAIDLSHQNITDNSGQNKKVNIEFDKRNYFDGNQFTNASATFTINGNDISGLGNIYFGMSNSKIINIPFQPNVILSGSRDGKVIFNSAVNYSGNIYSRGDNEQDPNGTVVINNNVTFTNKIGFNPNTNGIAEISMIQVKDGKILTAKSDIYTNDQGGAIQLVGENAKLIIDSSNNPILIKSAITQLSSINNGIDDQNGIVQINGQNKITIDGPIGLADQRVKLLKAANNSQITFTNEIFAKKIEIDQNSVLFEEDVDMQKRQEPVELQQRADQQLVVRQAQANMAQMQDDINQQRQVLENQIRIRDNVLANVNLNLLQEAEINNDVQLINLRQLSLDARNNWQNERQLLNLIIVPPRENWVVQDRGILEFTGDGIIKITEDKNILGDIRTRVGGTGTVIYGGDRQLQEQIGAGVNAKLKSIQFSSPNANIQLSTNNIHAGELKLLDAGQTLTIDNNVNFAGKITGRGTIAFAGQSAVQQIGELNARVAKVQAGRGNINFNQPIHADVLELVGNEHVTINNLTVPVVIRTTVHNAGHVIFTAAGEVGAIGQNNASVGVVEFRNGGNRTLTGNIYTDRIIFDNGVFNPQNQNIQIVVPQGNINNIPAGWQYVNNALKAQPVVNQPPPVVNNQQLPEQVNNQLVVDNQINEQVLEQPVNDDQPQLEQDEVENRIIETQVQSALQPVPQVVVHAEVEQRTTAVQIKESLLQTTTKMTDTNAATVQQDATTKALVTRLAAPVIHNPKNIEETIKQLDNIGIKFSKEEAATSREDTVIINKSTAHQAILYAASMAPLSKEERATTVNRMEQSVQAQIEVAKQVTETIHHTIDNRMNELSFYGSEINVSSGMGVAAGDDGAKHKIQGLWVRGLYGASKQGDDKGVAGYNGNAAGGTIGSDFALNEQNIIGIAYSNMRSSFKYKQTRVGDKTTGNSNIISLYSMHQLNDNFSLQSMLSAGMSKITTKRLVIDKLATGKVKNKSYSAEASINYKIAANENLYFVPNIGFRYAHYRDGAYLESGVGVHNLSVAAKSNNTFTAIAGVNMMMPKQVSETLTIIPSVQISVESYLQNKKQKVKAKLAWMNDYFENNADIGAKPTKFGYNIGAGLLAKHNNVELSANYNCNLHRKYQNHQGSVKLRILF